MGAPRMMLLDEPLLGLAPKVVEEILTCSNDCWPAACRWCLLVEENLHIALALARRIFVLIKRRIVHAETLKQPPVQQVRCPG